MYIYNVPIITVLQKIKHLGISLIKLVRHSTVAII